MMKDNLSKKLLFAIIGVIVLWLLIPFIVTQKYGLPKDSGAMGDTFGIVNSLFSALAFAFLIYTALMQREELRLQRKELKLTRKELERSAEAQLTLVKLTREQLDLELKVRKNEIKAELKLLLSEWYAQSNGNWRLRIKFQPVFHQLNLNSISLVNNELELIIDESSYTNLLNKYFSPGESLHITLFSKYGNKHPINGLKIQFVFLDIDKNTYKQELNFDGDIGFFNDPVIDQGAIFDLSQFQNLCCSSPRSLH